MQAQPFGSFHQMESFIVVFVSVAAFRATELLFENRNRLESLIKGFRFKPCPFLTPCGAVLLLIG